MYTERVSGRRNGTQKRVARRATTTRRLPSAPRLIPGAQSGARRPSRDWVTKTDLTRYARCPYSFWLLDSGQISLEDTVDEFQLKLVQEGTEFQERIESGAIVTDVSPQDLPAVLERDIVLLNTPNFENVPWKIFGRPDGIDAAEGALIPIEMKSHKDVQPTDELELAFYWMLLAPYRSREHDQPRGWLRLRRDGEPYWEEVPIRPHRFEEVRRLLGLVRSARRYGVQPRICKCQVCSHVKRDDVYRATGERKDLTLIWGIGRHYAAALEEAGIPTWEALLASDPDAVVAALRAQERSVSTAEVQRWQHHAACWASGDALFFGAEPFTAKDFIALDLEYDTTGPIWLIGACVVRGDGREYVALWADNTRTERRNLRQLAALVEANPGLPVVTWSGDCADIPQLRKGAKRLRIGSALSSLQARHVDLYQYARNNVRFPIPSLGLKEIGEYWGIPRVSGVLGGRQAQMMYGDYIASTDKAERTRLRETLLDYNREDVDTLVTVAERIGDLTALTA